VLHVVDVVIAHQDRGVADGRRDNEADPIAILLGKRPKPIVEIPVVRMRVAHDNDVVEERKRACRVLAGF
jgi:hypothetical protein